MTQIFVCNASDFIRRYEKQRKAKGEVDKRESRETSYDERDTMRGWSNSELGEVT